MQKTGQFKSLQKERYVELERIFVTLQVGMKNVFTNVSAIVLVLWYSLSVIGFDVHTCSGSGKTFIATVISGTACEDIHPDHDRKECSCCHHKDTAHKQEDTTLSTKPCCTDDWQTIVLTGVRISEKHSDYDGCCSGHCPCIISTSDADFVNIKCMSGLRAFCKPDSGKISSRDFQRIYGVWRI